MPVQFAEIALRRELAETREDALRLVSRHVARDPDGDVTTAVFDVAGAAREVRVRLARGRPLAADLQGDPGEPDPAVRAARRRPVGLMPARRNGYGSPSQSASPSPR